MESWGRSEIVRQEDWKVGGEKTDGKGTGVRETDEKASNGGESEENAPDGNGGQQNNGKRSDKCAAFSGDVRVGCPAFNSTISFL